MVSNEVRTLKFGMFPSNLLKLRSFQEKKKKKKADVRRTQEGKLNNCQTQHGELIYCLLLVKQNNKILLKIQEFYLTNYIPFPEVNEISFDN